MESRQPHKLKIAGSIPAPAILALVFLLAGCGYTIGLQADDADIRVRRLEVVRSEVDAILTTLMTEVPPIEYDDDGDLLPDPPPQIIDLDELGADELDALVTSMCNAVLRIAHDVDRALEWARASRLFYGVVEEEKQIPLNTDAEGIRNAQWMAASSSRAHKLNWWRQTVAFVRDIKRLWRRGKFLLKWGGSIAAVLWAMYGLWQWRAKVSERRARREAVDALNDVKRHGKSVVEAVASKTNLRVKFEGDRAWRVKHEALESKE